ncbi:hypothetical protein SBV1_2130016 [Verrucomicrobia bacterium]|nr:hypothetical protein SBV1_2130016 [Verrucomicrobiota bacterium]
MGTASARCSDSVRPQVWQRKLKTRRGFWRRGASKTRGGRNQGEGFMGVGERDPAGLETLRGGKARRGNRSARPPERGWGLHEFTIARADCKFNKYSISKLERMYIYIILWYKYSNGLELRLWLRPSRLRWIALAGAGPHDAQIF